MACLGSDSPISSKDKVNCDDDVDENRYEDVNWDDARHRVEDVFNANDAENLDNINVEVGERAEQPSLIPSSRLSRVSSRTLSVVSEVELNQIFHPNQNCMNG